MHIPDSWARARLTLFILAVTVAAWLLASVLQRQEWVATWGGFIPARIAYPEAEAGLGLAPFWLTPLTATLIHAGPIHLAFNMLILVFCGRAVEAVLGPAGMGLLYVVGAYAAAGAEYLAGPTAPAPMVGASGAISAVLGAYAILFGRNKVKLASPRLALWLNALWLLAAWVGLNLMIGIIVRGGFVPGMGTQMTVAVAAHIGGFLVGLLLAVPLLLFRYRKA
jgi:membrane associated rhomboid family serine protease